MVDQKQGAQQQPPKQQPAEAVRKSKKERFQEFAPKRTRQILKDLEILGNCSNRSGYEYTEENVEKIFAAITKKVAETKAMFSATSKSQEISFSL